MSGGKGGTSKVDLPGYLENFQKRNISRGESAADIGYMPWTGPEVAEVNPWERLGAEQQNAMSSAFGLGSVNTPYSNLPPVVEQAGVRGYSSYPLFTQNVDALQWAAPEFDARYRQQLDVPAFGSIYGRVNADGSLVDAPPAVSFDGMSNGEILDMVVAAGDIPGMSSEDMAIIRDLASNPEFRNNQGLLSYDPMADVARYDPRDPTAGGLSPEHASRIQAIQQRALELQSPTQRGSYMGETARQGFRFQEAERTAENSADEAVRRMRLSNEELNRLLKQERKAEDKAARKAEKAAKKAAKKG